MKRKKERNQEEFLKYNRKKEKSNIKGKTGQKVSNV